MSDEHNSEEQEVWINGIQRDDGSLLFAFDTDNTIFARGFEAGQIYFEMALRPPAFAREIHDSNVYLAKRMAKALNRPIIIHDVDGAMGLVKKIEVGPLPERPTQRMPMPMPTPGGPFEATS